MGKVTDKKSKGNRRKLLWQLAYIFGTLALLIVLGFSDPDLLSLFAGKLTLNGFWLAMCAVGMVLFWGLQACVYALTSHIVGCRVSFFTNVRIAMFGEYYSAITPFASGGQPMLIAYYKRYKVTVAKSSSILAVRYIGYVGSVVIFYLYSLVTQGAWIFQSHPLMFWLTTLGFLVNFLSILGIALLLMRASLVRKVGLWTVDTITKLPFLKNKREAWTDQYLKGVKEFTAAALCIREHPVQCLFVLLLSLGSVAGEFSVAYFVYRAMGLTGASFSMLFAMQTFLYLAVSFVPTPGGTGASEGGFYLFFALVFPKTVLYSAMLIWRLFTYYSQLLLGAIFVITDELIAVRVRAKAQQSDEEQGWDEDTEASSVPTKPIEGEPAVAEKEPPVV